MQLIIQLIEAVSLEGELLNWLLSGIGGLKHDLTQVESMETSDPRL